MRFSVAAEPYDRLPGELSADEILDGVYPYPPPPVVDWQHDDDGFAFDRLTAVPEPGIHPRVLFSPEDIPQIRERLENTEDGREMLATLRKRVNESILARGTWENEFYEALVEGDIDEAKRVWNEDNKPNSRPGHYQPYLLYEIVLHAFDCLIHNDRAAGRRCAAAVASYAKMIEPAIEEQFSVGELSDDVWRVKVTGPHTGSAKEDQGVRKLVGYHLLGYAYDFTAPFMTNLQKNQVRSVIALVTNGKVWLGAAMPKNWRVWNWVMVGLGQPLLALSIEGEPGYDERVYEMGVEILNDYLTYGITPMGSSTEAVGYTQFGFVWGSPFMLAAARRGDNYFTHEHYRAMNEWYLHTLQPFGAQWTSYGDGGDRGPAVYNLALLRHFYPEDSGIELLWQQMLKEDGGTTFQRNFHMLLPMIAAADSEGAEIEIQELGLPLTWFDEDRGFVAARNSWDEDAAYLQFEARPDSFMHGHEHADRGSFNFSALGRVWAKDNFRSVESRYHNVVMIDGAGQGFQPGPVEWLEFDDSDQALIASVNLKDAYDWFWPKPIITKNPDPAVTPRFNFDRWKSYAEQSKQFVEDYAGVEKGPETREVVANHHKGYKDFISARFWDEDPIPTRVSHNPVQYAYRTILFRKGDHPYVIVVDDIRKSEEEHEYVWQMQMGLDTAVARMEEADIVLADDRPRQRVRWGFQRLDKGERALLVRVLEQAEPALNRDYHTRGSPRLETVERIDMLKPEGRSFGLDKRLVIPSRSVEPNFKILLLPFREGDELPKTIWNEDQTELRIEWSDQTDLLSFQKDAEGRTRVELDPIAKEEFSITKVNDSWSLSGFQRSLPIKTNIVER